MRSAPIPYFDRRPMALASHSERGFVLIAAIVILLMLTLMSIGMFRSLGLEELITGNTREKEHAFYAAQSAMQYAEEQLLASSGGQGTPCAIPTTLGANSFQICSNTLLAEVFATTPWNTGSPSSFGAPYAPAQQITVSATGGETAAQVSTAGALVSTYYAAPQYAVAYLGPDPAGNATLYQVTTLGYGGNANALAVLQSVYSIKSGTRCVSKPC